MIFEKNLDMSLLAMIKVDDTDEIKKFLLEIPKEVINRIRHSFSEKMIYYVFDMVDVDNVRYTYNIDDTTLLIAKYIKGINGVYDNVFTLILAYPGLKTYIGKREWLGSIFKNNQEIRFDAKKKILGNTIEWGTFNDKKKTHIDNIRVENNDLSMNDIKKIKIKKRIGRIYE